MTHKPLKFFDFCTGIGSSHFAFNSLGLECAGFSEIEANATPTLRTGRHGILYVKNKQLRKLSGREALLLKGFDDYYTKLAQENFTQSKILSLAGNAMTVGVMRGIGKRILEGLSDCQNKKIVIANERSEVWQSSETKYV